MTVVCRTADELLNALNEIAEAKIEKEIIRVQTAMAVFCYVTWSTGKATWSKEQPNDYWSGQYRASINVDVGAIDASYAPDNPGEWPIHGDPYPAKDVSYVEGVLATELAQPYKVVWLSNAVPHAAKVEDHTHIAAQAAEFTRSHFAGEEMI